MLVVEVIAVWSESPTGAAVIGVTGWHPANISTASETSIAVIFRISHFSLFKMIHTLQS
jgi:hypothetical protein